MSRVETYSPPSHGAFMRVDIMRGSAAYAAQVSSRVFVGIMSRYVKPAQNALHVIVTPRRLVSAGHKEKVTSRMIQWTERR